MGKSNLFDVVVVGGGAAGMMAAIRASALGLKVALVEANDRVGKKLLLTGDGKCNITNNSVDITNFHSSNKNFSFSPIKEFSNLDSIDFFRKLGLILITLDDGKIFPITFHASTVLELLRLSLIENNVTLITNFKAKELSKIGDIFQIINANNEIITAKKVIVSTGGKSFPHTGSDGSGYELARMTGHRIVEPKPSLVQIKLDFPYLKGMAGVKFEGIASVLSGNSFINESRGEILFTNYGVSGPAILNLSRAVSILIQEGKSVSLRINFLPNFSYQSLIEIINNWIDLHPERSISNLLLGAVNKKIVPVLLKQAKIEDMETRSDNVSKGSIERIARLIIGWVFDVSGTLTFATAHVTAGGVDTRDIDSDTLESKLVKGLYFAGEVLDVDGDSGGYNLQWAWSSGWVAGSLKSK
jgi:predicted Rossmann fold flavoprotein